MVHRPPFGQLLSPCLSEVAQPLRQRQRRTSVFGTVSIVCIQMNLRESSKRNLSEQTSTLSWPQRLTLRWLLPCSRPITTDTDDTTPVLSEQKLTIFPRTHSD